MSQQLINHSQDLKKLKEEGYEIEVKDNFLLIHSVPYVNSNKDIARGILVSNLCVSENIAITPDSHIAYFKGEHPCNKDGHLISQIKHTSNDENLTDDISVNHSFSNKPSTGYQDYYEKMTRYIEIISNEAKAIDKKVTAKTFGVVISSDTHSVFNYSDNNSSRAGIDIISDKFKNHKIAIIGLGGTGSYVLDLVSKTTVQEIHLFDGDLFLQHNAFRSPSAASTGTLRKNLKKTDYFQELFSPMRQGIISHPYNITTDNINALNTMDFVFICIDTGQIKKELIDLFQENNTNFIDTGIGVKRIDDQLIGQIRVTLGTSESVTNIKKHISFNKVEGDEYSKNIQIAELNMLNATMAVIKWKKLYGFYQDLKGEFNSVYSINDNILVSTKHDS